MIFIKRGKGTIKELVELPESNWVVIASSLLTTCKHKILDLLDLFFWQQGDITRRTVG